MIKKIIKYHKRHLKGTGPFKSLFLSVVFYAFAVTGEAIRRAFQVVCAQVKRGITTGGCWKDEVCQLQHNLELWRPHFVFAHNVTILSKFSIQFLFPFLFSLRHEKKMIKKMIKYYKWHLKGTGPFKSQDPLPLCRFLRVWPWLEKLSEGHSKLSAPKWNVASLQEAVGKTKSVNCNIILNYDAPHFVFAHNVTILSKFSIQFLFPFLFSLSHETKRIKKI